MNRSFIVTLDIDPSASIQTIEKEMFESISYDFPEIISVKAFEEKDGDMPKPIEGEMFLGGVPQ